MTGFEAISHYNGWSQAIAGILIVMSGLGVLSFAISQLHKVAGFLERRKKKPASETIPTPTIETPSEPPADDINKTIGAYKPLIDGLEDSFQIGELYRLCKNQGFTHPHLSIKMLQAAGVLIPLGDGAFTWKP